MNELQGTDSDMGFVFLTVFSALLNIEKRVKCVIKEF